MAPADRYYEQANPDLLFRIPVTASAVLEVGCGAGALGRAFKRINPTTTYIGVELMPGPAAQACDVLDHVIEGDISQQPLTTLPGNIQQVDCLVFGDVLEHLVDPAAVLRQLLPWLKEDGVLLACIPNVQHWSVIANLLSGQWPQEDQGIFDRTHLRWFTRQSIITLINTLGLHLEEIKPRIFDIDKSQAFASTLIPSLRALNINQGELLEGIAPLQYVVRASKIKPDKLHISGLMMRPQAGMNDVRMIQPLQSLTSIPGIQVNLKSGIHSQNLAIQMLQKIKIWQRQMLTYANSLENIKRCLNLGYLIISEFDDDPDHWPLIKENKNLNFTAMHACQVSTQALAEKIRTFNPETRSFSNCLPSIPQININKWRDIGTSTPLRVFFGALNRQKDWESWINYLNEISLKYCDLIEFEVIHDRPFYEAINAKKKRFTPTCKYSEYIEILKNCHISLLPLRDTPFNRLKSDLKFIESAGCNTVAIASPTVYSNAIKNNITGLICNEPKDLKDHFESIFLNPGKATLLAKAAQDWCAQQRLQAYQTEERLDWYRYLWSKKAELTEALYERVPELKHQS